MKVKMKFRKSRLAPLQAPSPSETGKSSIHDPNTPEMPANAATAPSCDQAIEPEDVDRLQNRPGHGGSAGDRPAEDDRPVFGEERWVARSRQRKRAGQAPLPAKAERKRIRDEALKLVNQARDKLMIYPLYDDWLAYRNPKPVNRSDRESEWRDYGRGVTSQMLWYRALGGDARLKHCYTTSVTFKHPNDADNVAQVWRTQRGVAGYDRNRLELPAALRQFAEWWTAGLYPDLDVLVEPRSGDVQTDSAAGDKEKQTT